MTTVYETETTSDWPLGSNVNIDANLGSPSDRGVRMDAELRQV